MDFHFVGLIVIGLIHLAGALLLRPVLHVFRFSLFLGSLLAAVIISACIVFSAVVVVYF